MSQQNQNQNSKFPLKTFLFIAVPVLLLMTTLLVVSIWAMMNPPGEVPQAEAQKSAPSV